MPLERHTAAQGAGVGLLRGLVQGERRDGFGTCSWERRAGGRDPTAHHKRRLPLSLTRRRC